ncbi:MAG: 4Fe-4S binding protein, partial [Deltaproteobacteria bacterium]|nr:4Fe-4S binding protein [Deltaproteobacteria bacterium]
CVRTCPRGVLELQEKRPERYYVACSSTDRGPVVKQACSVGCIGCQRCAKACPEKAIKVENFLARIMPEKCTSCGECLKVCPTHSIIKLFDFDNKKLTAQDQINAQKNRGADGI